MRKIIGIGETVLDIIFKNHQIVGAVPGGSTFNSIISLGRCGADVTLITEVGKDEVGDLVINFMRENGVNTDYVKRTDECKTPLSLAFLNEKNDANYTFYKSLIDKVNESEMPQVNADDIVIFGSYHAVDMRVRSKVRNFIEYAKRQGAIIYYDINYRQAHRNELVKLKPNIIENLETADIVRGSSEDFEIIYRLTDADKVYKSEIAFYSKNFIYTDSSRPVTAFGAGGYRGEFPVKPIETVSTIGAGDNFNAGFIYGILKQGITLQQFEQGLTADEWAGLVEMAQRFVAECCKSIYNNVSVEFGRNISR